MKRERCPRCGGRLETESERWFRGETSIDRVVRCRACGERLTLAVTWHTGRPPSSGGSRERARWAPTLAWVAVALCAVWVAMKLSGYSDRAEVYRAVSIVAEAFLHPAWFASTAAAAVVLFLLRRGTAPTGSQATSIAPDVHIRAEPPGKISVVISGARGGLARDFVVDRRPDEEQRVLEELEGLARRCSAFQARPEGAHECGTREGIEETQRRVFALGLTIGSTLLGGGEAAEAIAELPGDHMQMRIQTELSRIPWELMVPRSGGSFLWQLFAVSRQIRDIAAPEQPSSVAAPPLKVLLMANLEASREGRGLPAAEREAAELMELGARSPGALRVTRKSPRSASELGELLSSGFDVVHFAGHTAETETTAAWVLADGNPVVAAEALSGVSRTPLLAFANACASAPGTSKGRATADTARSLMAAGVQAYLCTLWELQDEGSAAFSYTFYRAILGGATLAGAVNAARSALLGVQPVTWANYVLYGDPALRLLPGRARS